MERWSNEFIQFRSFNKPGDDATPKGLLRIILDCGLQSMFPNVYVALRLFLTLPVSNCEGERSFSPLSRIKNELNENASRHFLSWQLRATLPMHWTLMISWRISHGTEPGKNAFHRWNALLSINVRNCSYWVALSRFYLWLKAMHSKFVQIARNCIDYVFFLSCFG